MPEKACPPVMLIVDDHEMLRESLIQWIGDLFPDIVIHQASTGESAIDMSLQISPDLVLMDIGLPGMNGIDAMSEILRLATRTKIVIITNLEGECYAERALACGAETFIHKNDLGKKLPGIIESVSEYKS